jgi:hypothetical protein
MRRYFISGHPKFGSYKQPDEDALQECVYFWWWYALTLNKDYQALCETGGDVSTLGHLSELDRLKITSIYADFGDVTYEGNRALAFCNWWRAKVATGEERGAFLFAEPTFESSTMQINTATDAQAALAREDTILVAIPLYSQRGHIDNAIERILRRSVSFAKGRSVRDPRQSKARYHLFRSARRNAIKLAFELYDEREKTVAAGGKRSNMTLSSAVGLIYHQREKDDEVPYSDADRARVISMLVSRHLANARTMISNTAFGRFPF